MGKTLADPLFLFIAGAVVMQAVLYSDWRRLRSVGRASLVVLTAATLLFAALGTHVVESALIRRLSDVHPIPATDTIAQIDVVVVLSGGYVDAPFAAYAQPDAWSTARVVQGVRTFKQSGARLMVVTGRSSGDDPARLVAGMKQLAADLGVPAERIVVEPRARTTREHPIELERLAVAGADETIGVVTSSWHLPRAMMEFSKRFDRIVAVPAFDTATDDKTGLLAWLPRSRSLAVSATALAEYVGTVWYRLAL